MSAWVHHGGDSIIGNGQKGDGLWANVYNTYDEGRRENPHLYAERNIDMIKGRFARLRTNANKWVGAYNQAYSRATSGMNEVDIEAEAQIIYQGVNKSGKKKTKPTAKFNDLGVFKQVMRHCKKWQTLPGATCEGTRRVYLNEESSGGGSSKRSRANEDEEFSIPNNMNTPNSVDTPSSVGTPTNIEDGNESTHYRPEGRNAAKKKRGKAKVSESSHNIVFTNEYRLMRIAKEKEIESNATNARIFAETEQQRIAMEQERNAINKLKIAENLLSSLMDKTTLTPQEEDMKNNLMNIMSASF